MRLIDADRLKEVFERNTGYDYNDLIDIAPTEEAVPTSVIEDIKEELSHIDKPEPHNIGYESGVYDGVQLAITTIDKHISGKETGK